MGTLNGALLRTSSECEFLISQEVRLQFSKFQSMPAIVTYSFLPPWIKAFSGCTTYFFVPHSPRLLLRASFYLSKMSYFPSQGPLRRFLLPFGLANPNHYKSQVFHAALHEFSKTRQTENTNTSLLEHQARLRYIFMFV